ncbi:MAG: hypothetical protein QOI47_1345, partial [Actinomycetota bacterium]|nr:hypothetical protein [Actinomycetota bacterium]
EAAQSVRDAAADAAVELRGAAQAALDEAHEEVERILSDATAKAAALELESEARVRNRVEEAQRREAALRARLIEANEELQLALMALDGDQAGVDVRDERSSEVGRDVDRPEGSRFAPINDDIPAWS